MLQPLNAPPQLMESAAAGIGTTPVPEPHQLGQGTATYKPHGPAPRPASAESFLAATCIAWGHLQPAERKAIRACCRAGRLQHDGLLTDLRLKFGNGRPRRDDYEAPMSSQLRSSLLGVVGRGARLRSLAISFNDPCGGWLEREM